MQVIQQKLIWFLGCGSLLIILLRINLNPKLISRQALVKLKTGLIIVTLGASIGVLSHLGLMGRYLLSSGLSFYLESLLGYVFGGTLIIWGVIEWSKEYSDKQGEPLAKSRLRLFTEKVSANILREHTSSSFLEGISKYLHSALDCQAFTLHKCEEDDNLNLKFQSGLTNESEEILHRPQKESLFYAVIDHKQIMSSDNSTDLHSIVRLISKNGFIESGLSVPLISNGELLGVFTTLYARQREFRQEELELLEMISSALVSLMQTEKIEHNYMREAAFRELMRLVVDAFDRKSTLLSALLGSAKIAQMHFSFDEINLYVSANGPVKCHEFALPEGGKVNFIEGHFNRSDYLQLCKDVGETGVYEIPERQAFIVSFEAGNNHHAWLEMRIESAPIYINELMRAWSLLIARNIGLEQMEKAREQTKQWLGAIRFYQERALVTDNVAWLLQEMATLVIDLGMATFCRISLTDPQKLNFKSVALTQIRTLDWPAKIDEIPTAEVNTLRQALVSRKTLEFDQENPNRKIPENEASLILPKGVKHGLIIPVTIGNEAVGLLMMGEFRGRERALEQGLAELFASNLAALISMVLSWHKEKRTLQEIKEGKKKLTIIQREPQEASVELTPKLRSRLNGPLAGILASCEYLKNSRPGLETEVGHYLGIIERNAAKIHEITAEIRP